MPGVRRLATCLMPAAVFQGVIVGGGYGTGREVVEYVSRHGPWGGLAACAVIALGFALVLATSFALAQALRLADYRHFLRTLLGPGWVIYECLFLVLLVIVLAICGAAAGTALEDGFGLPLAGGASLVFAAVVVLNYCGRTLVERSLLVWTVLTMTGLVALLAALAREDFAALGTVFAAAAPPAAGAWLSGAKFAIYNSALIPVLIYCAAELPDRRTALAAGLVAGVFGMLPALALHLAFMLRYPAIVAEPLPTLRLLGEFGLERWVSPYFVLLFGTVVLTAVGVLHGLNERVDGWLADHGRPPAPRAVHAALAGGLLLLSLAAARFGIVALVAQGYGALAWGFFVVFTLPLLVRGTRLLFERGSSS